MTAATYTERRMQPQSPSVAASEKKSKKFLKGMRSAKDLRRQQQMAASTRSRSKSEVRELVVPHTASQVYTAFEEALAAAEAGQPDGPSEVPPLEPISYSSTAAEGSEAVIKAMSALHRLSFQYELEDADTSCTQPMLKVNAGPRDLKDLARLRNAVNALSSACVHANPGIKDEHKPTVVRRKPVKWDEESRLQLLACEETLDLASPTTPNQSAKPSSATFDDLAQSDAFEAFESFSSLTASSTSSVNQSVDSLITPPDSLAHQPSHTSAAKTSDATTRPPLRDFHSLPSLTDAHCRVLQVDAPLDQGTSSSPPDEDRIRAEMLNALLYAELPRGHELRRDSIVVPPIKSTVFKKGTNPFGKEFAPDAKDDRDKQTKRQSTYGRLTKRKVLNSGAPSPRIPSLLLSLSERSSLLAKVAEKSEASPRAATPSSSPLATRTPAVPPLPPVPTLPSSLSPKSVPKTPKTPKTPHARAREAESVMWRPSDSSRAESVRRKMTQGTSLIPPLPEKSRSRPTTIDMGIPRKGLGPASIDVDTLERLIKDTEAIREEGDKEWRHQNVAGGEVLQDARPRHARSSSEPAVVHEISAGDPACATRVQMKTLSVQSEVLVGSRTKLKSSTGSTTSVDTEILLAPSRPSTEDQVTPRATMTRSFSESQIEQVIEAPIRPATDHARASMLMTPMEELTTPTPTVAKSRMRNFQRSRHGNPYPHSRQDSVSSQTSDTSSHRSVKHTVASSVASSDAGYDSLFESDMDYASDGEQSVGTSVADESSDDMMCPKVNKARSSKAVSQYKPSSRPPKRSVTPPLGQPAYQIVQQIREEMHPGIVPARPDGLSKLRGFHSETQVHRLGDQAKTDAVQQLQDEVAQAMIDACKTFAKQDSDMDDDDEEGSASEMEALRAAKGKEVILWHLKTHTRGDEHLFPNPHSQQGDCSSEGTQQQGYGFQFPNPRDGSTRSTCTEATITVPVQTRATFEIAPATPKSQSQQQQQSRPKKSHMRTRHAPLDGSGTESDFSDSGSIISASNGRETPLLAPLRSNSISSVSSSLR